MATTFAKRVYDFKVEPVKSKLVSTFRRRRNESTIADLVAATGLPKYQVEQTAKLVLDEYSGHCKVTQSGEILYYFPSGMHSKITGFGPRFKRFMRGFFRVFGKILAFLFKIWIMVMLVGYFIVFLAIAVLAIVAAIAGSAAGSRSSSSRSRSRSGGGMMFLVFRLIELFLRIFFWVNITKTSKQKSGRPFYKSVFGFVFGDPDPNADYPETEKIKILSYIRSQKGVITADEFMAFTGKDYSAAQEAINAYLVEFEGEPMVTDSGTLFYFFPELLRTKKEDLLLEETVSVGEPPFRQTIPFSKNKGKTNVAIGFFDIFNLVFGSYFTAFGLMGAAAAQETGLGFIYSFLSYDILQDFLGIADPSLGLLIGFGLIPLSFSFLFILIPIIRKIRLSKRNEEIKRENLRKKLFGALYYNPVGFDPESVKPGAETDNPGNARNLIRKETDRYAGEKHAEVEQTDQGTLVYNFNDLRREIADIAAYRKTVDLKKYDVGQTVFDTNE